MKRILVVDDNTEYLQVLSSVLSGDFDTIKATGVKEALDILQAVTVDAICSDFNMKDGTGLDLLEKIRHKGLRTPFLLMSGDDSRTLEQKAKLYYGGFCCKTDFDLIRKIKALPYKREGEKAMSEKRLSFVQKQKMITEPLKT